MVHRVAIEGDSDADEIRNMLLVVRDYESALQLLDQYDHKTLEIGKASKHPAERITPAEIYEVIDEMRTDFSSELFGREETVLF